MNQNTQNNKRGNASRVSKAARKVSRGQAKSKPKADRPVGLAKGEVRVSAPISKGRVVRHGNPVTTPLANGDIRVRHREYIADVNGSTAFAATAFSINPGLPGTFPWLSTLARSFESYRFEKLDLIYETQSATTSGGTVSLAVDYDASDAAPISKAQSMDYRSSVRCPVWSDCKHHSLREDLSKRTSYYVRGGALDANQDIKLYDVGNAFACSSATPAGAIGELYVDYDVILMTPQIGKISVGQAIYGLFTGSVNSAPFAASSGNLPAAVVSTGTAASISTWTFTQPWEGYVSLNLVGTSFSNVTPSGTATSLELADVVNAAATNEACIYSLNALQGQTFILTVNNVTVSASSAYFAQADS